MTDVRERVLNIVEEYAGKEIKESDISLFDDLGFDSLQVVGVLAEIEENLNISFEDGGRLLDMVDHLEQMILYVEKLCR